jgi:sulfatase modifying factor 1
VVPQPETERHATRDHRSLDWTTVTRYQQIATAARTFVIALLYACGLHAATFVEPHTQMKFVLIPAGSFNMGSPTTEKDHRPDEGLHRVTISRPFYLGAFEVTQAQWTAVMGYNHSQLRGHGEQVPVETVTWFEVQEFLRRLNELHEGHFRLPTEAEWEYACRAGSKTAYAFGNRLRKTQANFDGKTTVPVGSYEPNAWGLYDMHGNVWEWCADEVCPYPRTAVVDPRQSCGSRFKPIRGGSWYFGADSARSALRYTHEPQLKGFSIGFRVVRDTAEAAR